MVFGKLSANKKSNENLNRKPLQTYSLKFEYNYTKMSPTGKILRYCRRKDLKRKIFVIKNRNNTERKNRAIVDKTLLLLSSKKFSRINNKLYSFSSSSLCLCLSDFYRRHHCCNSFCCCFAFYSFINNPKHRHRRNRFRHFYPSSQVSNTVLSSEYSLPLNLSEFVDSSGSYAEQSSSPSSFDSSTSFLFGMLPERMTTEFVKFKNIMSASYSTLSSPSIASLSATSKSMFGSLSLPSHDQLPSESLTKGTISLQTSTPTCTLRSEKNTNFEYNNDNSDVHKTTTTSVSDSHDRNDRKIRKRVQGEEEGEEKKYDGNGYIKTKHYRRMRSDNNKHRITITNDQSSATTVTSVKMIHRGSRSLRKRSYAALSLGESWRIILWSLISIIFLTVSGISCDAVNASELLAFQIHNRHQSSLSSLHKIGDGIQRDTDLNNNADAELSDAKNGNNNSPLDQNKLGVIRIDRLTDSESLPPSSSPSLSSSTVTSNHRHPLSGFAVGSDSYLRTIFADTESPSTSSSSSLSSSLVGSNEGQTLGRHRVRRWISQPQTNRGSFNFSLFGGSQKSSFSSSVSTSYPNSLPTRAQLSKQPSIFSSLGGILRRPLNLFRRRLDNPGRAHASVFYSPAYSFGDGSVNRLSSFVRNRFNKMSDSWRSKMRLVENTIGNETLANNNVTEATVNASNSTESSNNNNTSADSSSILVTEQVTLSQSTTTTPPTNVHAKAHYDDGHDTATTVNSSLKLNLSYNNSTTTDGDNSGTLTNDHHDRHYGSVTDNNSSSANDDSSKPVSREQSTNNNNKNNRANIEANKNHVDDTPLSSATHSKNVQISLSQDSIDKNNLTILERREDDLILDNDGNDKNDDHDKNSFTVNEEEGKDLGFAEGRNSVMLSKPVTLNVIDVDPVRTKIAHNILIVRKSTTNPATASKPTPPPPVIISTVMKASSHHQHNAQSQPASNNKHKSKTISQGTGDNNNVNNNLMTKINKIPAPSSPSSDTKLENDQSLEFVPIRSNHGWSSGGSIGSGFEAFSKWRERNKNKFPNGVFSSSSSPSPSPFPVSTVSISEQTSPANVHFEMTPTMLNNNRTKVTPTTPSIMPAGTTTRTTITMKTSPITGGDKPAATTTVKPSTTTPSLFSFTFPQQSSSSSSSSTLSVSKVTRTTLPPKSGPTLFTDHDHEANFHWFTPSSTLALSSSSHLYSTDAFTLSPLPVSSVNWALAGESLKTTTTSTTTTPSTTTTSTTTTPTTPTTNVNRVETNQPDYVSSLSSALSTVYGPYNEFSSIASSSPSIGSNFGTVTTIKNEFDLTSTINPGTNYDETKIPSSLSSQGTEMSTASPLRPITLDNSNPQAGSELDNSGLIHNSTNEFENAIAEILIDQHSLVSSAPTPDFSSTDDGNNYDNDDNDSNGENNTDNDVNENDNDNLAPNVDNQTLSSALGGNDFGQQSRQRPTSITLSLGRPQKPLPQMQSVIVSTALGSQSNEFDAEEKGRPQQRYPKPTLRPFGSGTEDSVVIFKNNHGKFRKRRPPMSTRRPHRPRTTPLTTIRLPQTVTAKPPYIVEFATHQPTPTTTVITTRKPPAISVTNISANRLKAPEDVHSAAITVQDPPFVPGVSMKLPLNTTIVHKNLLVPMKAGRPKPQYPTRPSTEFPIYAQVAGVSGWPDATQPTTSWIPPVITTTAPDKIAQFLPSINQAAAAEAAATATPPPAPSTTTASHRPSSQHHHHHNHKPHPHHRPQQHRPQRPQRPQQRPQRPQRPQHRPQHHNHRYPTTTTSTTVTLFADESRPIYLSENYNDHGSKSTTILTSTSTTTTPSPTASTRRPQVVYTTPQSTAISSTTTPSTPIRRHSTHTKKPAAPYVNAIYMPPMPVLPPAPNLDNIKPLPMWARWLGRIMNRVMPDPTQPVSFMSLVRSVLYSVMIILIPPMAILNVFTA